MPRIEDIRGALSLHEPTLYDAGDMNAAVAVALCEEQGATQLLLIRRSEREGDPWSGHLSFPGGRLDASDESLRHAAERETREEVGLDLAGADYLGRLDDLRGVAVPIIVSAFVYAVEHPEAFVCSDEVREAFWVPLEDLLDAERQVTETFEYQGNELELPAIELGDGGGPPLWGLTYHFLEQFFSLAGRGLPPTPWREDL